MVRTHILHDGPLRTAEPRAVDDGDARVLTPPVAQLVRVWDPSFNTLQPESDRQSARRWPAASSGCSGSNNAE